jgi:hypothetical protein
VHLRFGQTRHPYFVIELFVDRGLASFEPWLKIFQRSYVQDFVIALGDRCRSRICRIPSDEFPRYNNCDGLPLCLRIDDADPQQYNQQH